MDEIATRETWRDMLNHHALISCKDAYGSFVSEQRAEFHKERLNGLRAAAHNLSVIQAAKETLALWT